MLNFLNSDLGQTAISTGVPALVTIIGFIVTYFAMRRNVREEIKKQKNNIALEKMATVPFDIMQLDAHMIAPVTIEKTIKIPTQWQAPLCNNDTNVQEMDEGNIVSMKIPFIKEHTDMNKGIENILELEKLDLKPFYHAKTEHKDYGGSVITNTFDKMELCDYICSLDESAKRTIFANFKGVIDKIVKRVEEYKEKNCNR